MALDDVAGAARMAVADLQGILDGLDPAPSNIVDIDAYLAEATAFIDSLSGDALSDDLSDQLQEILDGVEDGVSDIFDLVDLVPDILAKVNELTALLETDLSVLLTELTQTAQDEFIAAIEALASGYIDQIRDAIFRNIFNFGVLDFNLDTANGVFDIGLLLEPKFVDLSEQGLSLDFSLDPFPVGAEFNDLNIDFEVGGLVDIGLRLDYGLDTFDLLVDGGSEVELNALLVAEGEIALKLGAIGVQLGDQPDDPARIALTDLGGKDPAFFNIGIDGGTAGDFISISSVGFEVEAEAQVEASALFFDSTGAAIITDPNDDGMTDDGSQVEIGLTAMIDETLTVSFGGDGLDQDEIDAILESLIAFDLTTILDAIETFLELAEIGLGEDALGSLPIVGEGFTGASDAIEDSREQIFGPFRDALETIDQGGEIIALLQTAIHDAIGGGSGGIDLLPDIGTDATA